jgi:YegS/Rv2252/BmrU family lipid kinase
VTPALVVINPVSGAGRRDGGGAAEVELARVTLAEGGFDARVVVTTGPGHATEAAREACARGVGLVVAWGGDGTMNDVARVVAFSDVPLAIVPAGSGNGLARDLGVPKAPRDALAVAAHGRRWRIDAGAINDQLFFNVAGVGLDARIAQAFADHRGRRGLSGYARVGSRELLRYRPQGYEVQWPGAPAWSGRALFIAVANSRQYGSHGFIAPRAALDDGRLDLVIVDAQPLWRVLVRLPEFFLGTLQPRLGVQMTAVERVRLASGAPWDIHLDGEPRRLEGPLDVSVRPRALTVAAPL